MTITDFPVEPGAPPDQHKPYFIIAGPAGELWFTEFSEPAIGRMSTAGQSLFPVATAAAAFDLTRAPDDTVYWTTGSDGHIYRRLPVGTVQSKSVSSPGTSQETDAAITVVDRLRLVGRVPLGRFWRGSGHIRWDRRVNGRRLGPGLYQVTVRSVTSRGGVRDLGRPVLIRIRDRGRR